MSREKISPFCPNDCIFLNKKEELFHRGCGHLEDIIVDPPVEAETITKPTKRVQIVGADPRNFYGKMEGQTGVFSFFKDGLRLKRKKS